MIKNSNALFTSKTDDWATPQDFFNELNKEFNFTLDVCASEENAKCAQYFTKEIDGLKQEWHGTCFMNPPYGREISKWMEKAYKSSLEGATVVCLVPSRTDTKWWHEYAMKGQIRFIKGRLKFGNSKNSAPFPSALVIFGGGKVEGGFGMTLKEYMQANDCSWKVAKRAIDREVTANIEVAIDNLEDFLSHITRNYVSAITTKYDVIKAGD